MANRVDQNQKQKTGSTQFIENTRKMGMILLMTGYYKEPIATGSIIKRCNFLMKFYETFKGNFIHKTWVIIGQADRDTDKAESKAFFDCIYET